MENKNSFFIEEIINNIPYFIFWKDINLNYLGANLAFAKSAGFTNPKELIGLSDFDCCWTREESEFFRMIDRKVMKNKMPILNIEEPQQQLDGSTIILLTSKVPLFDDKGEVAGILGIYCDITERKKLENEKDHALSKLKEVQELLIYQEKMKSLGEMAGGIAHEINNPLAIIKWNAEILKKISQSNEVNRAHLAEVCSNIVDTVDHCTSIITNLKNFSRDGENDTTELVFVSNIVDSVISLCKEKIALEGVKLVIKIGKEILKCKKISVEQSLLNLLHNSLAAVNNIPNSEIQILSWTSEDHVGIDVIDNGIGISPEIEPYIFQPFFTTKKIGEGTGLGLSTSKGLIEKSGGQLLYQKKNGKSCFTIQFDKM